MSTSEANVIPAVWAGPVLRRLAPTRITLWVAACGPADICLSLTPPGAETITIELSPDQAGLRCLVAGRRLAYLLVDIALPAPLPEATWISYRLSLRLHEDPQGRWQDHTDWAPDLCYPGQSSPGFRVVPDVRAVLHGSCRKPHSGSADGLAAADRLLARLLAEPEDTTLPAWPSALIMSGDQVYVDDVAGPMLAAIHALVNTLGLPVETLPDDAGVIEDSAALYAHANGFYGRETFLPRSAPHESLADILFGGARKPVFTSVNAHNHLITLGEMLAMYLLVWSPAAWTDLAVTQPAMSEASQATYAEEERALSRFVQTLAGVRRVLAHVPVAMIFDDHDVTDDWNLNREWEETAYAHPLSTRMIGNALVGYLINQAWGNDPDAFPDTLLAEAQASLDAPGSAAHDKTIDTLLHFDGWQFAWPSSPPLIVLDTRTRRWRSETAARRPSGLLDWEALTDLQRLLRERDAVLLVSAAPIFGVKLIEAIQKVFTWLGKPLLVDAEYWLAHPGTADGILNVFRHRLTPRHFVVLSGDVHYSFVYDVELRGRTRGPDIWQICSSGLTNTFPDALLDKLDRANRWLYAPRSPLNWLTQRRRMRVIPRKPQGSAHGRRLLNASGIGVVELDSDGAPWRIRQLCAEDDMLVAFDRREAEARWD